MVWEVAASGRIAAYQEKHMKYSGIGGQAVMEGIMMKNGDAYAVAVRKPDQEDVSTIIS